MPCNQVEQWSMEYSASVRQSRLLSNLAHKIGNQLNAIIGFGRMMSRDSVNALPIEQSSRLERILSAGLQMQLLMRDVVELSRFETGKIELRHDQVDVAGCIRESVLAIQAKANSKHVRLEVSAPAQLPAVTGDSLRLRQCLINLLTHSINATTAEGCVKLIANTVGDDLHIRLSDSGARLSPEQLEHLFEPFSRFGHAGSSDVTGIELSITRHLLQAMGGQIRVANLEDQGVQFELELPLEATYPAAAGRAE